MGQGASKSQRRSPPLQGPRHTGRPSIPSSQTGLVQEHPRLGRAAQTRLRRREVAQGGRVLAPPLPGTPGLGEVGREGSVSPGGGRRAPQPRAAASSRAQLSERPTPPASGCPVIGQRREGAAPQQPWLWDNRVPLAWGQAFRAGPP